MAQATTNNAKPVNQAPDEISGNATSWTFKGEIPQPLIDQARAQVKAGLCQFINYDRDTRELYVSGFFMAGEENNFTVARVTAVTVEVVTGPNR